MKLAMTTGGLYQELHWIAAKIRGNFNLKFQAILGPQPDIKRTYEKTYNAFCTHVCLQPEKQSKM